MFLQRYPDRAFNTNEQTPLQVVRSLQSDPDTLLFYDAADSRYDGGQIPYDASYRHFDGYLGSLWPANISPAGYEPTTDLYISFSDDDELRLLNHTQTYSQFDIRIDLEHQEDFSRFGVLSNFEIRRQATGEYIFRDGVGSTSYLTGAAAEPVAVGERVQMRLTWQASDGACEISYRTDGDLTSNTGWTSLGTDTGPLTNYVVSAENIEAYANSTGSGKFYGWAMGTAIGTLDVLNLNFTRDSKAGAVISGTSAVTDLLGNDWKLLLTTKTVTDNTGLTPDTKALKLPGTTGNYVSTPDAAVHDITGDIDVRVYVELDDWTPASAVELFNKYLTTGDQRSWKLTYNTTGSLTLFWSTLGTGASVVSVNSVTTVASLNPTGPLWIRATLDVSTGNVNFYTSDDDQASWDQLGAADLGGAGATSIHSGSGNLGIGANYGSSPVAGLIYAAEVYDGIAGTLVLDVDFDRDAGLYDTSFTGNDGLTYTVNQSAATTNDPLVFSSGANADYTFDGTKYVYFPGTNGNYLSAPGVSTDGVLDIRAFIRPDDQAPSSDVALLSRWTASSNDRAWQLQLGNGGDIEFAHTEDGTTTVINTYTSDAGAITFPASGILGIRVTVDPTAGDVTFYTSSDNGATWDQEGTVQGPGSAMTIHDGGNFEIGSRTDGAQQIWSGLVYSAFLSVGGTTVIDFDVNRDTIAADHSTITDAEGNVWTVNRTAAPSFQTTIIDRPLWLFGSDTYIYVPASDDWSIGAGAGKTAIVGFRAGDTMQAFARLIQCRDSDTGTGWRLSQNNLSDEWNARIEDTAGLEEAAANVAATAGEANVVSLLVDDAYVQGRANGTNSGTGQARDGVEVAPTDPLVIMARSDNTSASEGTGAVHFVAVFDRALTEKELRALEIVYG